MAVPSAAALKSSDAVADSGSGAPSAASILKAKVAGLKPVPSTVLVAKVVSASAGLTVMSSAS